MSAMELAPGVLVMGKKKAYCYLTVYLMGWKAAILMWPFCETVGIRR